jgi:rhodanese-related sulfurtransferase
MSEWKKWLRLWGLSLLLIGLLSACGRETIPDPATELEARMDDMLARLPQGWGLVTSEQLLEGQPFLVDVREPYEYATGFIEGAVNIPLRELTQHLDALPGMDQEIVLVCCSIGRSSAGMAALKLLGYENVKVLAGGMQTWRAAGLPVVGGPGPALTTGPLPEIDADLLAAVDRYLAEVFPSDWGAIRTSDLSAQIAEAPPVLLDVRQPEEFARDHLEGAINIPLRQLGHSLDQIPRDQPIIAICGSGHRSTIAMMALQMLGYQDVKSLEGGMTVWSAVQAPSAAFYSVEPVLDGYLSSLPQDWGLISGEQVLEEQPFLVDVREPDEYAGGFIEGAVNIPLRGLAQHLEALPGMDQKIVAVCDSGTRSAIAMAALQLLGYEDVSSLAGGVEAWQASGVSLVTEPVQQLTAGAVPQVEPDLLETVDRYLTELLPPGWGLKSVEDVVNIQPDPGSKLDVALVDVREPQAFEQGHVEGAFNLPLRNLIRDLQLIPFKELTSG